MWIKQNKCSERGTCKMPTTAEEEEHAKNQTAEERSCEVKKGNPEIGRPQVTYVGAISM